MASRQASGSLGRAQCWLQSHELPRRHLTGSLGTRTNPTTQAHLGKQHVLIPLAGGARGQEVAVRGQRQQQHPPQGSCCQEGNEGREGSPRMTSLMWVCMGPLSRFCTTALAIRVRWPMLPRLMPPAALKGNGSIKGPLGFPPFLPVRPQGLTFAPCGSFLAALPVGPFCLESTCCVPANRSNLTRKC